MKCTSSRRPLLLLLLLLLTAGPLLWSPRASAFKVTPMVLTLLPSGGPDSAATLEVQNDRQEEIALEVMALARARDGQGREVRTPTTELVVYPPQLTIAPGQIKNIRLLYKGSPTITRELPYRVILRQLAIPSARPAPVATTNGSAEIKFLFEYVTSIYVRPPGVRPQIELAVQQTADKKQWRVQLKNRGNEHVVVKDLVLEAKRADQKVFPIDPKEYAERLNENLLPGTEVHFTLAARPYAHTVTARRKD